MTATIAELKPGEVVLLHNWTLHRSDVNKTDIPRRGFSVYSHRSKLVQHEDEALLTDAAHRDNAVRLRALVPAAADRLRRFEQEARATGMLNHPNLLTVYDVGRDDDGGRAAKETSGWADAMLRCA